MKRHLTACKIIQILFLAIIVMLLPVTVWAQETTLTTSIPHSHTMQLALTGEGTVLVDGVAYTKTDRIQIQRQHMPEFSVSAADGSKIKTILWGNEDITAAFRNGKWIAPKMLNDTTLTVTFEKISNIPQTADTFQSMLWTDLLIISTVGVIVCLLQSKQNHS